MSVTSYPSLVLTMGGDTEGMDLFTWLGTEASSGLEGRWGLESFTVYINGEETDQEADSITASEGDQVEIAMTGGQECFPVFHLCPGDTAYPVASIDEPLPLLGKYPGVTLKSTYIAEGYASPLGTDSGSVTSPLASVCDGLMGNNTQLTSLRGLFMNCAALGSVPEGVFGGCSAVTSLSYCFCGCSSLSSLPDGLLGGFPAATDLSYCFSGCSSLPSLPDGLLDGCAAAGSLARAFQLCVSLESVPEGLLAGLTEVTDLTGLFRGCSSLVPSVIIGSEKVASASLLAYGCAGEGKAYVIPGSVTEETLSSASKANAAVLPYLPGLVTLGRLSYYHGKLLGLLGSSYAPYSLVSRLEALEERVTALDGITSDDDGDSSGDGGEDEDDGSPDDDEDISSCPALEFTLAEDCEGANVFAGYDLLLGAAMFSEEDEEEDEDDEGSGLSCLLGESMTVESEWGMDSFRVYVNGTLDGSQTACSITASAGDSVRIVMTGGQERFPWFGMAYTAELYYAIYTLYGDPDEFEAEYGIALTPAPSIASIDAALPLLGFAPGGGTAIDGWEGMSLLEGMPVTEVPSGLFSANPGITSFSSCFSGCGSLADVPESLFSCSPLAADFSSCFDGCSALEEIPSGLFSACAAAEDFSGCFLECAALAAVPDGLFDANAAATDFSDCFKECSSLSYVPEDLFLPLAAVTSLEWCFRECPSLVPVLRIGSEQVASADYFAYGCQAEGTVYVPEGSVTEETFASAENANVSVVTY